MQVSIMLIAAVPSFGRAAESSAALCKQQENFILWF